MQDIIFYLKKKSLHRELRALANFLTIRVCISKDALQHELANFAYRLWSLKVCKTILRWCSRFSLLLKYTRISSMEMITKYSKKSLNTQFIRFMKVARAFVNPEGHYQKLVTSIVHAEHSLRNILLLDP